MPRLSFLNPVRRALTHRLSLSFFILEGRDGCSSGVQARRRRRWTLSRCAGGSSRCAGVIALGAGRPARGSFRARTALPPLRGRLRCHRIAPGAARSDGERSSLGLPLYARGGLLFRCARALRSSFRCGRSRAGSLRSNVGDVSCFMFGVRTDARRSVCRGCLRRACSSEALRLRRARRGRSPSPPPAASVAWVAAMRRRSSRLGSAPPEPSRTCRLLALLLTAATRPVRSSAPVSLVPDDRRVGVLSRLSPLKTRVCATPSSASRSCGGPRRSCVRAGARRQSPARDARRCSCAPLASFSPSPALRRVSARCSPPDPLLRSQAASPSRMDRRPRTGSSRRALRSSFEAAPHASCRAPTLRSSGETRAVPGYFAGGLNLRLRIGSGARMRPTAAPGSR